MRSRKQTNLRLIPANDDGWARDYVGIAVEYAQTVVADKAHKRYGLLLRLACKRFLHDLKRASSRKPPFTFDDWHACNACDFIEKLPHVEGVWDSDTIVLIPAHVFFVVNLFGFRDHKNGRRFTSALLAVARKNAKSTLAAGILLCCLCLEDEPGAQIISAATTGDQARIIWGIARAMVDKCPDLRNAFDLATFANSVTRLEIAASFKPINAKASTQDGLNPSHTAMDEVHAHKDASLINVLTSAAGARRHPLWLYTTTEGYINTGPWQEMRHFANQILTGAIDEIDTDHFLVLFFCVDDKDDDFDETIWLKANPLAEHNDVLFNAIRKEAVEAKAMPSKLAEFRIKRLNRQSSSAGALIDISKWKKSDRKFLLEDVRGHPCYGGLDLSSILDLTSLRLVWRIDEVWYTHGWRWIPRETVDTKASLNKSAYKSWVTQGQLIMIDSEIIEHSIIEEQIRAVCTEYDVQSIAYDPWNAVELVGRLVEDSFPMVEFIQGPKSYHPAIQELERAYIKGKFRANNDPVLRWCASNLVARFDANMNMAPDKKKSPEKIDDMCALLMAIGRAISTDQPPDVSGFIDGMISA